jgi:Family of unknown function (DUF5990)
MKKPAGQEISLRITLVSPPSGVVFCLQRGRADLVSCTEASGGQLSFDFTLRVHGDRASGPPNFRGEFAQGPPATRFVYVNSGTLAGQAVSCWTRRAKVPLAGITWDLIDEALSWPGSVLEARIAGTAKDGGPVCASVPLLGGEWRTSRGTQA